MCPVEFEPDTITVRAYSRKPPTKRASGSFEESAPETSSAVSGGPETAFGQPISQRRLIEEMLVNLAGGAATLAAPEVAGPAWALRAARGSKLASQLVKFGSGAAARATMAGGAGAATSGLLDVAQDQPIDPSEMVRHGGTQAALSGAGDLLAGGFGIGGNIAMQVGLRASPEVAQTALREGIRATRRGVQKLLVKLGQQGRFVGHMLRQNRQTWDPTDILNGGGPALVKEVTTNQTGMAPARWEEYRRLAREFVSRHSDRNGALRQLTAEELHKFKQDAHEIADPIFKRIGSQNPPSPTESAVATWHKAMGDYAQQVLERTTPDAIDPVTRKAVSLAEVNARSSDMIRLKDVLVPETKAGKTFLAEAGRRIATPAGKTLSGAAVGAGAAAAIPGGDNSQQALLGALIGALVGNPAAMSKIGLLLASQGMQGTLRQAPRAVNAAAYE
jgi:hypothetical protein